LFTGTGISFVVFVLFHYLFPALYLQASARKTMRFCDEMINLKEGIEVIDEEDNDKEYPNHKKLSRLLLVTLLTSMRTDFSILPSSKVRVTTKERCNFEMFC